MNTLKLIKQIFSKYTAPFREFLVLNEIRSVLHKNRIPYFEDEDGNIVAGVSSASELKKCRIGFMAHTDHPGFHIQRKLKSSQYSAKWYGGAPFKQMVGASLWILDPHQPDLTLKGKISSFSKADYTREGLDFTLKLNHSAELSTDSYGAFDFPGYKLAGHRLKTRVADDLTGVVIILGLLMDQKKHQGKIAGIFTRAEEVGYVGCWSLLTKNILPKDLPVVSLEASRTLPGARLGEGPVLRLGDYSTIFDSALSIELWNVAKDIQKKKKSFKFQRRLMDGGSCEATALSLFGLKTTGVAVPLANYHNQGARGPAPEIVDVRDVDHARKLCSEFASHMVSGNMVDNVEKKQKLHKNYVTLKELLKRC